MAMAAGSLGGAAANFMYQEGRRRLHDVGRRVWREAQYRMSDGGGGGEPPRKARRLLQQPMYRSAYQRSRANWRHLKNCVEYKTHEANQATTQAPNTGTIASVVSGIAHGDAWNTRQGRKIYISRLQINGHIDSAAAGSECQPVRVLVVQDRQANGATPTLAEVLNTAAAANPIQAYRNLENTARFKILMDKKFMANKDAGSGKCCIPFSKVIRFPKGLHVTYDASDTAGASAQIFTNNVWVISVGHHSTATNNGQVTWTSRIRFTD